MKQNTLGQVKGVGFVLDSRMTWITVSGIAYIIFTLVIAAKKYSNKFDFILLYAAYLSFTVFTFMHMNWYALNHYLRFVVLIISLLLLIPLIRKVRGLPFFSRKTVVGWTLSVVALVILTVSFYFNVLCLFALGYKEEPINLEFPFKDGMYIAYNAGNGEKSPLMNYHMSFEQWQREGYEDGMKYAIDLVKINKFGFYSEGIHPRDAEKYETFGETVYSPCDGVVYDVSKSSRDIVPYSHPVDYGNRIVLKADDAEDVFILMVHLQEGRVDVKIGDKVEAGQAIAKVGNSGMTLYPHLHIQATRHHWLYGEGVPILFDNRVLLKNSMVTD